VIRINIINMWKVGCKSFGAEGAVASVRYFIWVENVHWCCI